MHNPVSEYFRRFPERFGDGWNRFWFRPSDPLTLCVLRLAAGLLALYLHLTLSFDLVAFFSADGLLPPSVVAHWAQEASPAVRGFPTLDRLSYLSYVTSPAALWVLHGVGFAVLVAFTLGLFTRYSSIAALVVVLSYMHRGPMLVSYVEPVLAMVMFYLCLAPCGACLSLDSLWRSRNASAPGDADRVSSPWATVAMRLLQLHFSAFCFMMGLSKLAGGSGQVWWSGEAMWMLIARPESRLIDLTWLAGHPFVIDVWTHMVVWFELAFPILVWNRFARPLALSMAVLVWGSLIPVTGLTTFYVMLIIASWSFVEPSSWRALREYAGSWLGQTAAAVRVPAIAGEGMPETSRETSSASREQSPSKSSRMARRK